MWAVAQGYPYPPGWAPWQRRLTSQTHRPTDIHSQSQSEGHSRSQLQRDTHQRQAQSCPGPVHCSQFVSQCRGHGASKVGWWKEGAVAVGALVAGRSCVFRELGSMCVEAGPMEEICGDRKRLEEVATEPCNQSPRSRSHDAGILNSSWLPGLCVLLSC